MPGVVIGGLAPKFELMTDRDEPFKLSDHRGHAVVLFFYPEDDTEGCTIENLEFTALMPDFVRLGVVVVGISPDPIEKHCKFRDKHGLGVMLASDIDRKVLSRYGAWGPKKLYGREYDGVIRTTFLVGPTGRIVRQWTVRRIRGHAAEVLEAAAALSEA